MCLVRGKPAYHHWGERDEPRACEQMAEAGDLLFAGTVDEAAHAAGEQTFPVVVGKRGPVAEENGTARLPAPRSAGWILLFGACRDLAVSTRRTPRTSESVGQREIS